MADSPDGTDDTPISGDTDTCFVIMPFGGRYDQYYEDVFKPAIADAGLSPRRADDLYRPGTIINDIWELTRNAEVIVADLTTKNANVLYELGLAHAVARPVVIVSESVEDVPFDLRALRVIEYDKDDPAWGELLREKITKSIQGAIDSPLSFVLPTFIEATAPEDKLTATPAQIEMLELRREVESLRREILTRDVRASRSSRRIESEGDAREAVREMIQRGASDSTIMRDLSRRGVPETWLESQIPRVRDEVADEIAEERVRLQQARRGQLEKQTVAQLRALAADLGVRGRSSMVKMDLVNAILRLLP